MSEEPTPPTEVVVPSPPAKDWWRSKTVLGALAIVIPLLLQRIFPGLTTEAVLAFLMDLSQAIGSFFALLGLRTAHMPLTPRINPFGKTRP